MRIDSSGIHQCHYEKDYRGGFLLAFASTIQCLQRTCVQGAILKAASHLSLDTRFPEPPATEQHSSVPCKLPSLRHPAKEAQNGLVQ